MHKSQLRLFSREDMFGGRCSVDVSQMIPSKDRRETIDLYHRMQRAWALRAELHTSGDRSLSEKVYKHHRRFCWPGGTSYMPRRLYEDHVQELLQRLRDDALMALATRAEMFWELVLQAEDRGLSEEVVDVMWDLAEELFGVQVSEAPRAAISPRMRSRTLLEMKHHMLPVR